MFYEPGARDRALLPHDPFKAIIAPRPIGWISTLDAEGTPNLAPYSFFNAVADSPPIVMFQRGHEGLGIPRRIPRRFRVEPRDL